VKRNTSLNYLYCARNYLTDKSATILISTLCSNFSLCVVNLLENFISRKKLSEVDEMCKATLNRISGVPIFTLTLGALSTAAGHSSHIRCLPVQVIRNVKDFL